MSTLVNSLSMKWRNKIVSQLRIWAKRNTTCQAIFLILMNGRWCRSVERSFSIHKPLKDPRKAPVKLLLVMMTLKSKFWQLGLGLLAITTLVIYLPNCWVMKVNLKTFTRLRMQIELLNGNISMGTWTYRHCSLHKNTCWRSALHKLRFFSF